LPSLAAAGFPSTGAAKYKEPCRSCNWANLVERDGDIADVPIWIVPGLRTDNIPFSPLTISKSAASSRRFMIITSDFEYSKSNSQTRASKQTLELFFGFI
jgi:hypothetical protein